MTSATDRTWDKSKPPAGSFTLNRDCPQAQGLVSWWPGGNAGLAYVPDFISRRNFVAGTAGGMAYNSERAPTQSLTAASSQFLTTGISIPTAYPLTLYAYVTPTSLVTAFALCFGQSTTTNNYMGILMLTTTGVVRTQQLGGGAVANVAETTATLVVGREAQILGHFNAVKDSTIFLRGANAINSTTGDSPGYPAGLTELSMGSRLLSSGRVNYWNGLVGECGMFDRATSNEVNQRMNTPSTRYELWYPLRSAKWIMLPAAAAAVSIPAISSQPQFIGSGVL